jgi:hypothetical protein
MIQEDNAMKRLIRHGSVLFAAGMLSVGLAGEVIPQQIRDHRSQREVVPANRGSSNEAIRPSEEYVRASFRPSVIPADLETFLNTRMTRHELIAVSHDTNGGYYQMFLRPLRGGSRSYKVVLVQDNGIDVLLSNMSRERWRLVSVTSEWHGPRGLMHLCFFRQI